MAIDMRSVAVSDRTLDRLYRMARAERWSVPRAAFAEALQASAGRAFADNVPGTRELDRYLGSLHLEDLALALACASGHEAAWDHFVHEHRPMLYRSANAIDPAGGARELADSLYGDLYGLTTREGTRNSLFRYFHGRSSLATWLRAVLAQRHVDRLRAERRLEPLSEESPPVAAPSLPEPDRPRYEALINSALGRALSGLTARDRLRLGCYYSQGMTLAETGRLLHEHEATVSRQLSRTRRLIREAVERHLKTAAGLTDSEIVDCFRSVAADAGPLDLDRLLAAGAGGKETDSSRST
jgi:RNA polymerase sigma-70 factor (ECF subfamily)